MNGYGRVGDRRAAGLSALGVALAGAGLPILPNLQRVRGAGDCALRVVARRTAGGRAPAALSSVAPGWV